MSPAALGAIATAAGGTLLLVGWGLRDRGARRTERLLRDRATALAEELASAKTDLAIADQALEEYREALPKAFDLGMQAGVHLAEHQLATAAVERAQREKARWN